MAVSKSDILLLLTELQRQGKDVKEDITQLYASDNIPVSVLKTLNSSRCLDIINFYEKLRKSYNNKKSKLYINIMKSDEQAIEDAKSILTTLSAMLNQILQYEANDKPTFLRHSRAEEITQVLRIYFSTFNIEPALRLLRLIKADAKVFEMTKM